MTSGLFVKRNWQGRHTKTTTQAPSTWVFSIDDVSRNVDTDAQVLGQINHGARKGSLGPLTILVGLGR